MLIVLSIVALVNVVLLVVACCMLYFLMKKRMQQSVTGIPCPGTTDVEKGSDAITTETAAAAPDHQRGGPSIGLGQSAYSLRSLNSAKLCPTPKRTPFGGARKADALNGTFASSMSSLGQSLSLEGLANLNAQLEALKNKRNNLNETFTSSRASLDGHLEHDVLNQCVISEEAEEDGDSGYGSGLSSEELGKALDEVLGTLYKNLEDLKPTRPRTMSLSLPRLIHTPARHPSSTGITLDPICLDMEF